MEISAFWGWILIALSVEIMARTWVTFWVWNPSQTPPFFSRQTWTWIIWGVYFGWVFYVASSAKTSVDN